MTDTCPPCHHNCNQGRTCPARNQRLLGEHMKFIALVGLLALTACGTYAVRMYEYGNAERGEAPVEAPAERGDTDAGTDVDPGPADNDKGEQGRDKGDNGDRDNDKGDDSEKGESDDGRGREGKDKGDEGDDD